MRRQFLLLLLLLPLAAFGQGGEAPVITVLDFQASGISEGEITIFTDFIASHIVGTGKYTVIDRMQRRAILAEIEFSYADCTDEACQLEIGKLLSASQIIVGSLGKFGAKYILNIKLVEVETGKSLAASSKIYNSLDDLLQDSQNLTLGLLGVEAAAPAASAKKPPAAAKEAPAAKSPDEAFPESNRIPRAAIQINGNFDDWAEVPARLEDRVGDKRGSPAMGGVDLEKVLLAKDDRYLYVFFAVADGNLNWNAIYDFGIEIDRSIHLHLQTYYDQWQQKWIAHIGKWEIAKEKWTNLETALLWTKGNSFEARYPLSAINRYVPAGKLHYCWGAAGFSSGNKWTEMDMAARTQLVF
jgi:TolB-like protein